jgi:hypothetical protein
MRQMLKVVNHSGYEERPSATSFLAIACHSSLPCGALRCRALAVAVLFCPPARGQINTVCGCCSSQKWIKRVGRADFGAKSNTYDRNYLCT